MKKIILIFLLTIPVIFQIPCDAKYSPVLVTFIPLPLDKEFPEYTDEELSATHFALGLPYSWGYSVYGLQVAIGSIVRYNMVGCQIGGINYAENVYGVQLVTFPGWSELFNPAILNHIGNNCIGIQYGIINWVGNNFIGLQVGVYNDIRNKCVGVQLGIINLPKYFTGIQLGFLINGLMERKIITEGFNGIQFGLIGNAVRDFQGFQCAILGNVGKDFRGLQIGLINFCQNLKGVQIGVLNIAYKSPIPAMIGINVGW